MPAPGGRAKRDTEDGVRREKRAPITTLDGGCHDARWQAAGLGSAPVLRDAVARLHDSEATRVQEPQPALVGAGAGPVVAAGERPW